MALARMLYALLTGYWPGDEATDQLTAQLTAQVTALPPAPVKGRVCTPRQVRAGVPAILDAITYRALHGQAADAPLRRRLRRAGHGASHGAAAVLSAGG